MAPIKSTHLELKASDIRFKPVLPSPTRTLGHTVLEYMASSGPCRLVTLDEVVDVPLLDALHQVLAFPEVQEDLGKVKPAAAKGLISDISDGLLWPQHPLHGQHPLRLGIYNDAIEYVEAIGAFRCVKKVVHFYIALLNLSPEVRHQQKHMILLCSVHDKTLNKGNNICTVVSGARQPAPNPMHSSAVADQVALYNALQSQSDKQEYLQSMGAHDRQHFLLASTGVDLTEWAAGTDVGSFFRGAWFPVHSFNIPHNPSTGLGPGARPVVSQLATGDRLAVHAQCKCKMGMGPRTKRVCYQCSCGGHEYSIVQDLLRPDAASPFTLTSSEAHNQNLQHVNDLHQTKHWTATHVAQFLGLNPGDHMFAGIPGFNAFLIDGTPGDLQHIELEGLAKV